MKAPGAKKMDIVGPSSGVTTKPGSKPSRGSNPIQGPTRGVTGKPSPKPGQGNQIQGPTKGR